MVSSHGACVPFLTPPGPTFGGGDRERAHGARPVMGYFASSVIKSRLKERWSSPVLHCSITELALGSSVASAMAGSIVGVVWGAAIASLVAGSCADGGGAVVGGKNSTGSPGTLFNGSGGCVLMG